MPSTERSGFNLDYGTIDETSHPLIWELFQKHVINAYEGETKIIKHGDYDISMVYHREIGLVMLRGYDGVWEDLENSTSADDMERFLSEFDVKSA